MTEDIVVVMPDNKYVALLSFDDTLVPLLASSEMTHDYLLADGIFKKLLDETIVETYEDEKGNKREMTRFHPDLKWWFEQKFKIEKEIAKLNLQAGVKEADLSLDIVKILLQDKDILTPKQRREIGKQLMKKRMRNDKPVSDRD